MSLANTLPLPAPAAGRIPGNKGIWVGIFCELTEFALMFVVFFLARAHNPEAFHDGPARLATSAGVINTVLMLSSSYFVARSLGAIRLSRPRHTLYWLAGALACGVGYLIVKTIEFAWYAEQGINGVTGVFFTTYYYLAFNHLVHVGWGSLGILWVMARTWAGAYSPEDHERKLTLAWLFLLALTLSGGYLGETAEPGLAITLIVAAVIAIKGRLVIDHFMELSGANRRIRRLMNTYFYVLPAMVIAVDVGGPWLARLTAI